MTTIPNLNVVVQQGGAARDAQNIRPQSQDASQVVAAQQTDKETEQRNTVQDSNESEALKQKKKKSTASEHEKKKKKKKKDESEVEEVEVDPDAPGQLLDIQA